MDRRAWWRAVGAGRGWIPLLLPVVVVLVAPICLRERTVGDNPQAEQLVIVSPHNEAIRYEFEHAFGRYCREALGREVDIDWRTPGGTSELVRYVRSEYTAAFRHAWTGQGHSWSPAVALAMFDRKLVEKDCPPEAWQARQGFLGGNTGIGIDLFFGGGQYDYGRLADEGVLVPCGLRERHPEWLAGSPPALVPASGGEIWFDQQDRYYGVCLSSFGICYNPERWAEVGMGSGPEAWPRQWDDLGDPRLLGHVGLADPSKSGSIAKCYEMLIQQKMRQVLADGQRQAGRALSTAESAQALDRGWRQAMLLLKRIGGNARYFTSSASRVPVDVGQGMAAAGMCIDFYGRAQAEWAAAGVGREVMSYVTPLGGSSVSADPVALLRGAPHAELARTFIDFCLSPDGQRLWDYRVGEPGGPVRYSLRRLPMAASVYTPADRRRMADGDEEPFRLAAAFEYHPEWTGRLFSLIRVLIRVMAIDCHAELRAAWADIAAAGGPEAVPEAMERLSDLPFTYAQAADVAKQLGTRADSIRLPREWAAFFRQTYAAAGAAARQRGAAGAAAGGGRRAGSGAS